MTFSTLLPLTRNKSGKTADLPVRVEFRCKWQHFAKPGFSKKVMVSIAMKMVTIYNFMRASNSILLNYYYLVTTCPKC